MTAERATTVRFGRVERRGVLLGLSGAQLVCAGGALTIAVIAEYTTGYLGLLVTAPAWLTLAAVGLVVTGGRPLIVWIPVAGQWRLRRICRRTTQVTRPMDPRPVDTLKLPGIAGHLALSTSTSTGAAYLLDPRTSTVTAIAEVTGRGFVLDDPGTQDRRVAGWGRVLASLCQQPDVVRVQVLQRSLPGGANAVRRWWKTHTVADASWAARVVADLLDRAQVECDPTECLVAIVLRAPRGTHRRLTASGSVTIDQQLAAFHAALGAADLDVRGWVTPHMLRRVVRSAYDPAGVGATRRTTHREVAGRDGFEEGADGSDGNLGVLGLGPHRLRTPQRVLDRGVATQ